MSFSSAAVSRELDRAKVSPGDAARAAEALAQAALKLIAVGLFKPATTALRTATAMKEWADSRLKSAPTA